MTIKQVCEITNTSPSFFIGIQSGVVSPIYLAGANKREVKPQVQRIIDTLGCTMGEAFPAYTCEIKSKDMTIEQQAQVTISQASRGEENWYHEVLREKIEKALRTLTPREEAVLRFYFLEEGTLRSVAKLIGRTDTRVEQIKQKAIRKLRHPGPGDRRALRELWQIIP